MTRWSGETRVPSRRASLALLLLLSLAGAACGQDGEDVGTDATDDTTENTATTTAPTTTAPTTADEGSSDSSPKGITAQLQRDLADLGYYDGPVNGEYDEPTEAAVREFQSFAGIAVDGIYGPQTTAALDVALGRSGDSSGGEETTNAITATVDGSDITFNNDIACVLGPDDSGSIQGTADDGTTIDVTLDGTASRVVIEGSSASIDAPFTAVSNDQMLLTVEADPPPTEALVLLSICAES